MGTSAPERLSRTMVAAVGALLLLHVALAWLVRQPAVMTGNDDALYLLLGRAIRAFTYRDLFVLGQPWHAQYPPGYPLLLALLGGTLGPEIGGPILLGITLSTLSLLLFFDTARRFVPPLFAVALLAALAVNPQLLSYAGSVRSETPYVAFTALGLWFLVRREDRRGALVAGASFVLLAALTRMIGVAFVAALAGTWLLERRWRRLAWFGLAAALTVGLWLAWIFVAPQQFEARSYGVMLVQSAPAESTPVKLLLSRAVRTVNAYVLRGNVGTALGLPRVPGARLDDLLGLGFVGALILAGMITSWRRGRLLTVYVLVFAATLSAWTYKILRFLVPIVPVLTLLACIGAAALACALGAGGAGGPPRGLHRRLPDRRCATIRGALQRPRGMSAGRRDRLRRLPDGGPAGLLPGRDLPSRQHRTGRPGDHHQGSGHRPVHRPDGAPFAGRECPLRRALRRRAAGRR